MKDLLHLAELPGAGGIAVTWALVVLLIVAVLRAVVALLDAALDLRNKWLRRPR